MTVLLRGRALSEARAALADLSARTLRLRPSELRDLSLADGLAGVALVHAALHESFPRAGHQARAERLLLRAIARLEAGPFGPGLHTGLAGLGWVAAQLLDPTQHELFGAIDRALLGVVAQTDRFDLIHGLTGIGVYALERLPDPSARALLSAIVARLADGAKPREVGVAWWSDPQWISCDPSVPRPPHQDFSLGVAHGTPGVIALLGRVADADVDARTRAAARALLERAVAWLLAQELPRDAESCFSYHAVPPGIPRPPARVAWCNGDPGIAAALLVAARATRTPAWRRAAVRIGLRAAARPCDRAGVVDAGLCHGAAGVAHIFHRLFLTTRDARFADAARRWFAKTLELRAPGRGFAGFRALDPDEHHRLAWRSAPGFLTGAAGVALALAAATTGADAGASMHETASCTDVSPDETYTCGEQVGWGKCGEPWMAGHCDRSCGRCPGIGNVVEACTDIPPGTTYTCAQQASWGKCGEPWMAGKCDLSCNRCPVRAQLIDPAATAGADRLMRFLVSVHRTAILSGQQTRADADYMATLTGRYPAIVGFDLMNDSPSRVEHGASSTEIDLAIEWSRDERGLVTLSWHWNAPADLVDSPDWPWWKGFYTRGTTFDLARAMYDRTSTERRLILRDIDAIAVQLRRLQDAGVPVLWRPIHEASGGWFWWGAHGPQPYLMLWRLLYDRLVNHHQLHNLIWVWNGQHRDWYPGDAYVDIVAEDIYDTARDHEPQEAAYVAATRYSSMPKLVALSETGTLLDPARLASSAARWSWFNLWSGDFARAQTWNEDAMKRQVYASDFVVTLDELPWFEE